MKIDNTPYQSLANAIVESASNDLGDAYYMYLTDTKHKEANAVRVKNCEKFFYSTFYDALTRLDGKYLVNAIKKHIDMINKTCASVSRASDIYDIREVVLRNAIEDGTLDTEYFCGTHYVKCAEVERLFNVVSILDYEV